MRRLAPVLALALLVVTPALAGAHRVDAPLAGAVLSIEDRLERAQGAADARRERAAERADALGQRVLPAQPDLRFHLSFAQAGVKGEDTMLAAVWVVPAAGEWHGLYAVDSSAGIVALQAITIPPEGAILTLWGGMFAVHDSSQVVYRFLGADGRRTLHAVGPIAFLDEAPLLGHVDAGGAAVSRPFPHTPAAPANHQAYARHLFVTPWNLVGESVVMGFDLLDHGGNVIDTQHVGGCRDLTQTHTEPGCRVPYLYAAPAEGVALRFWHLDARGERVEGRLVDAQTLALGYVYGA